MARREVEREETGAEKLRWVKLPRQARSQEKLERFVAAAERLINARGFAATTVPDIAREAGCSVGLFYTRFRDKQELLRYLFEHYLGEAAATARLALADDTLRAVPLATLVRQAVTGLVRIHQRRPGVVYAFYETVPHDAVLAQRVLAVHREIEAAAAAMLRARAGECTHPDPALAARFALRLVTGVLQQRALASRVVVDDTAFDWPALTTELVRSVSSYLGLDAPPAMRPSRQARAAVTRGGSR